MPRSRLGPDRGPLLVPGCVLCLSGCVVLDLSATDETRATRGTSGADASSDDADGKPPATDAGTHSGPLRFVDVTAAAGLQLLQGPRFSKPDCLMDNMAAEGPGDLCSPERFTGGAAVADYDDDGLPDIFVARMDAPDALYRNRGDGTFENLAEAAGMGGKTRSNGALWVDVDNDGDPDLYVTSLADDRYRLFINHGDGTFSDEAEARGVAMDLGLPRAGMSIAAGDYDRDGWPDLFLGEWRPEKELGPGPSAVALLRNLGPAAPGSFEDMTDAAGIVLDGLYEGQEIKAGVYVFSPAFVDLDGDGWQDLALASDFRTSRLFWNNGDGTFLDGTDAAGVGMDRNGMGSTFGDYDGDGLLDWFVTAIFLPSLDEPSGNFLYRNLGERRFSDMTDAVGVRNGGWGWGTAWIDHDNDGDLDLIQTGGWYRDDYPEQPIQMWRNDGSLPWIRVDVDEIGLDVVDQGRGVLTLDFDDDGDLDILVVTNGAYPRLYRNDGGNRAPWLRVRLHGTTSTADALGAVVRVQQGDREQVQHMGARTHYLGQSEPTLHFGLGAGGSASPSVHVLWPSGAAQLFPNVEPGTTLGVIEP